MGNTASVTPATVLAVVRGLLARDVDGQPVGVTGEDLRVLHEIRNLVDADFVRCVGVFDARGGAGVELHLSTKSWLRVNCRMSATSAHGRVAIARRLRASLPLPGEPEPLGGNLALAGDETGVAGGDGADVGAGGTTLSDAMFAGGLSYEHAVAITRAVDALPAGARGAAEQVLVGHAPTMDPGTLRRFGEGIRETLAPELLLADAEAARDRRFLNVSPTFDGMVAIDGMLDADGGALVLAAVNALATPTGPDDTRTAAQRRADAFVEVTGAGLRAGELPQSSGVLPHVTLTVDVAPLIPGGSGIPIGRTPAGLTLVGSTVERILCDASISRVLTQGAGHVLDVGRAARLATPAQRRGLAIRDGGCVGYECDRPPAWTDVHHVVPWSQGGLTDFDVLCLLCRRHHTLVHDDGWVCVRDGTGWIVLPPELARDPDRDRDRDTAPPDTAITPTAAGTSATTPTRGRPVPSEWLHGAVPYCPADYGSSHG